MAAALELAWAGLEVVLLEKGAVPGGKLAVHAVGGKPIDAGPTVLTMRWVFDELLARGGTSLADHLRLEPCEILARHAFADGSRLDLFADAARTEAAIGDLAGAAEAAGYRAFRTYARRIYETVEKPFLRSQRPGVTGMMGTAGLRLYGQLKAIDPWRTMWKALGDHFRDPRLLQLFGRYATYTGSSPFLAPATLHLVAHVEGEGVWRVPGGMYQLGELLTELARRAGVRIACQADVAAITTSAGAADGVVLHGGERLEADAVICNADAAALAAGAFGANVARGARATEPRERSLSAVVLLQVAKARGFPLVRHNVFFGGDSEREFRQLFAGASIPDDPTVYVCAQDRGDAEGAVDGAERLLVLVNAPAVGGALGEREIEACRERATQALARAGLRLEVEASETLGPADWAARFPATGGALYGRASHGWNAAFLRPGARTQTAGLYLAGGSVHPGAGVPMAAQSGRLAAQALLEDLASTRRFQPAAMRGGTSTG